MLRSKSRGVFAGNSFRERAQLCAPFLFLVLFFLAVCFNIWKAKFGSFSLDESFYLSIPYRLRQGDLLLIHEWHLSQMNAFLLAPILDLYLAIFGSVEGIGLHFRYIYIFFHSLTALFLYFSLRKHIWFAAAASALLYELFSVLNIMALSYNSMGIGLMLFSSLGLLQSGQRALPCFLSGLAFAGAVLCCPFLVIVYLVYALAVLCRALKKPSAVSSALSDPLAPKAWAFFTAACVCLAGLFFYPLIRAGMLRLLPETLPLILNDPEHPARTFFSWAKAFFLSFPRFNSMFWPSFCACLVLALLMLLDKRRSDRRALYLLGAVAASFVFSLSYLLAYRNPSLLIFPIHILGLFSYFLCEGHTALRRRYLLFSFLPGMLYGICIDLSSNNSLFVITSAAVVSLPASFLFIFLLLRELMSASAEHSRGRRAFERLACLAVLLFLAVLFCGEVQGRMESCYHGASPREMSAVIRFGTQKGLHDTPELVEEKERLYESLAPLRSIPTGNVLYWVEDSTLYLEDEKNCASYSAWFTQSNAYKIDRLQAYWSLFPEKMPDYIYFPQAEYEKGDHQALLDGYSYTPHPVEGGVVLALDR